MLPHSLVVSEQYTVAVIMNTVVIRSTKPVMPFIHQQEISWAWATGARLTLGSPGEPVTFLLAVPFV